MQSIMWDVSTDFDQADISKIRTTLLDFDEKLKAVGLLEHDQDNVIAILSATIPTLGTTYAAFTPMLSLIYKMPTGNGKVIYEDVVGEEYKKISTASYDSTNCYIKFEFGYFKPSTAASNTDTLSHNFCVNMYISKLGRNSSDYTLVSNNNFGISNYTNSSVRMNSPLNITPTSVISMNEDSLTILWLKKEWSYSSASMFYTTYSTASQTIAFQLFRKDGNIMIITPELLASSDNVGAIGYYTNTRLAGLSKYNIQSIVDVDSIFKKWFKADFPESVEGRHILLPTFVYCTGTYFNQNFNLFATKKVPSTNSFSMLESIIYHNGVKIKRNFVLMNDFNKRWKPNLGTVGDYQNYTFAFSFDDYPLTTEAL